MRSTCGQCDSSGRVSTAPSWTMVQEGSAGKPCCASVLEALDDTLNLSWVEIHETLKSLEMAEIS